MNTNDTRIKLIRKQREMTQSKVAKASKIAIRNYQRIEKGEAVPKVNTAILIADTLDVLDLRELFG